MPPPAHLMCLQSGTTDARPSSVFHQLSIYLGIQPSVFKNTVSQSHVQTAHNIAMGAGALSTWDHLHLIKEAAYTNSTNPKEKEKEAKGLSHSHRSAPNRQRLQQAKGHVLWSWGVVFCACITFLFPSNMKPHEPRTPDSCGYSSTSTSKHVGPWE
ncbi:hypothetical protein K439DRAFT_1616879 [Ramaria rubella]|nr:hypothetical protein K439DRAFT_1616879 [Ramaria rubella]